VFDLATLRFAGPQAIKGSDEETTLVVNGNIPTAAASEAHLCLGKQFVDAALIKADDDLFADDNRRSATAFVGPNQFLQRRGIFRDVALDEINALLRKILFRGMAGASTVGGEQCNSLVVHKCSPFW
jgi:hypothetical protein